ncbi:ribonuclease H-like domain-containing protein [Xylaria sp. FL1777]|nr:ribonuclease H-like domain-containing protein [Xylaria sp. FL1777]
MVYFMKFYVDGGCRRNGTPEAIGAAACLYMRGRDGSYIWNSRRLPQNPRPTNERAEITAIIMALEWALERFEELDSNPRIVVRIHSDSKYAIGCMVTWINKWEQNGWINCAGREVSNRDLIERAAELNDKVKNLGSVKYIWIPRSENEEADEVCNDELDKMEDDETEYNETEDDETEDDETEDDETEDE